MAKYRRVGSGIWGDLSLWEDDSRGFFNPSTELPGFNDDVYLNSFVINLDDVSSVAVRSITNGTPIEQNANTPPTELIVVGGYISINNSTAHYFTCNMYNYSDMLIYGNVAGAININILGDCYNYARYFYTAVGGNNRTHVVSIVGDVSQLGNAEFMRISGAGTHNGARLYIIGNVFVNGAIFVSGYNSTYDMACEVVGGLTCIGGVISEKVKNGISVVGNVWVQELYCSNFLQISDGTITNDMLIAKTTIRTNIHKYRVNYNGVEWHLATELVGGLPAQEDVRSGVTYGLENVFTGTLDLPQEATVLRGVKYDNSNKSGTLDVATKQFITEILGE